MKNLQIISILLLLQNPAVNGQEGSWYENNEYVPLAEECLTEDPAFAEVAVQAMSLMGIDEDDYYNDDTNHVTTSEFISTVFEVLEDYCDEPEIDQFESALAGFQQCSGIDMKAFIETFNDAAVGALMNCGRYLYENTNINLEDIFLFGAISSNEEEEEENDKTFLLPPVPEQCIDAILGHNPLGDMVRNALFEHPGLDTQCFSNLSEELPSCTLKQWPINLPGSLLKFATCVRGSEVMPILQKDSCEDHLLFVGNCLDDPIVLEGRKQDKETCDRWIQDCDVSILSMPSPFIGLPLSDICQEHLEFVQDGAKKLAAFQDSCVSDEDKAYWRLEKTSVTRNAPFSSSEQGRTESNDGKSASKSVISFFSGLMSGMFMICAILFLVRKRLGSEILYSDLNMKSSADVHQQDRIMV